MAILFSSDNTYAKIDFDNCSIRGNKVYVSFDKYNSMLDRDNEKDRQQKIADFFHSLRVEIWNNQNAVLTEVEALGKSREELVEDEIRGKLKQSKYPALRARQDYYENLDNLLFQLNDRIFVFNRLAKDPIKDYYGLKDKLMELGFSEDWIINPIHILAKQEVYCGEYEGEKLSHEFYYNRLKSILIDNILDV